jgi:HK97 family phage prohead protease
MIERQIIERCVPLLDLEIERSGDGRTVVAYAAAFENQHRVFDNYDGDIDEIIDRSSFNRTIGNGVQPQVIFNHGRDLFGESSDRFAMPLGTPLEVKAEDRGLLTRTAYARTDLADEVLELIRAGAIRGQSFRGAMYRSKLEGQTADGRPIFRRLELGLTEYGPTPFPQDEGAVMLALRSTTMLDSSSVTDSLTDPASDGTSGEHSDTLTETIEEPLAAQAPAPDPGSVLTALANAQRRRRVNTYRKDQTNV